MSDWEAHGPDGFGDFNISSKGEKLAKCVVVQNGFRTPEETAAIAAHLIKAVNNHNALVKALEHMTQTFRPFTLKPVGGAGSQARIEQQEQIGAHSQALEALRAVVGPSRNP